jgi:endoglucanase
MLELLRKLTSLPGPSGFEQAPAVYMLKAFRERGAHAAIDQMGNVVAHLPGDGDGRKLLICAHTDEVGFIVRHIDDDGFIYVDPIGILNPEALPGAQVELMVEMGETPTTRAGVIGTRSPHVAAGAGPLALSDLWIDIGERQRTGVEAAGIRIGTPVTFRPNFTAGPTCINSKALDNRIGCALLLALLDALAGRSLPFDLYLAAAVQEEVGSRGAQEVARRIDPDWAIVIDTVPATDPSTTPQQTTIKLGGGPGIRSMDMMPNMMGTLYAPVVVAHLEKLARERGIAFQHDVSHTWTDAATMTGVLRGGVYIPRRYAHGPAELVCLDDIEATLNLLTTLVTDARTTKQLSAGPWPA